ncbi:MAG: hypothetical protein II864_03675 [Prevotella sp.]|nr:hypothetical protein [Prevotella sp.]
MKKYLKPDVEVMDVVIESLLQASITEIEGLEGVTTGGEFPGGATDSRSFFLFNED